MRFAFTADQIALADGVRAVLSDQCPPSVVRAVWDDTTDAASVRPAARLWRALADLGLIGALVPEEHGGLGLNELDVLLGLEESGRVAAPVPLLETAVVAARLLTGTGQADRLAALAAGALRVSAVLDGSSLLPWTDFCDLALVFHADAVYLVPTVQAEPVPSVDRARPLARLRTPPEVGRSCLVTDDRHRIGSARRAGRLAAAAQLIGLGERMLEMTVTHVKQRHQFGVPIGSFQAVKHALADALLALELARPLVHAAAWSLVHDRDTAARDVAAAKIRAGEAAGTVARTALQAHGGMGYTQEYDLHLWLKRTWALQASWGHPAELRPQLAATLLQPSGDHARIPGDERANVHDHGRT